MVDGSQRETKDITHGGTRVGTADIVAIGAVIVAIIIALGIVFGKVDGKTGAGIIVALLGAAGVAKIAGAGSSKKK